MLEYFKQIPIIGKLITGGDKIFAATATTYAYWGLYEYQGPALLIAVPLALGIAVIEDLMATYTGIYKSNGFIEGLTDMYEAANDFMKLAAQGYDQAHDWYHKEGNVTDNKVASSSIEPLYYKFVTIIEVYDEVKNAGVTEIAAA